jgi:hypothetical protein
MIIILLIVLLTSIENVYPQFSGGDIDLFTQKKPYNGEGLNMPSDSFEPGETVIVYALVTYNNYPVENALVSLVIQGPRNPILNITQSRVVQTNMSGIATISLGVGLISEIYWGEWWILGTVRIAEDIVPQDTLTFKVGNLICIQSIRTINEDFVEQSEFMRGGRFGVELTIRNIAFTEKTTTITLTVYDELGMAIQFAEIRNLVIPPNGILVYPYFLSISKEAVIGEAVVYACAYTAPPNLGGIAYCPEVFKYFYIASRGVAIVSVRPDRSSVYRGELVSIDVEVENKGWKTESFEVSVFNNNTMIDVLLVSDLQAGFRTSLTFEWDTSNVFEGKYQISAYAAPVIGEIDEFDNTFVDGFVEIKEPDHNVAVINVESASENIFLGDTVDIRITLKNKGNFEETFTVIVYYDLNVAGAVNVESLEPNSIEMVVLQWNTRGVSEGNYTLSAFAGPVAGEKDITDNSFENGIISLSATRPSYNLPWWFWWVFLFLLSLLVVIVILILYRRKKRRKEEETFYSGWTAWYYCNDLGR